MRKCDFCRLFHTEKSWHAYWFSAVIVSGRRDLPSDARTFIAAKKAHQSSARRRHVKDQKTCLEGIIYIKLRVTCRPKKWCKSNLSTVSVLANGSLHQDLMHSGCRGTTVPNVCLQALTLSLLSPRDFFTLSPNREPAKVSWCLDMPEQGSAPLV